MPEDSEVFRLAYGLWITPDFAEVAAGRKTPPYVDYTRIDYAGMQTLLAESFHLGPRVVLRVANDVIDLATLSDRNGASSDKMHCKDFGTLLIKEAARSSLPVIPIRKVWQGLHTFKDRQAVPPPAIVPILIEAEFEDAVVWGQMARPILGLKPFEALESARSSGRIHEVAHEGKLPAALKRGLAKTFMCDFTSFAMLDQMASDPIPR